MHLFRRGQNERWRRLGRALKDHLIPHEGNGHHPHALKHHALIGYSLFLVLIKVAVIGVQVMIPSASVFSTAITPSNIVSLTNQTRENLGIKPLQTSPRLMSAAQAKADHMKTYQYFAHTAPDGTTPWNFIHGAGYQYQVAGENLAIHYIEAEDVESGWMASPTHRQNIVDERYTNIGVGVTQGNYDGYYTTFVVQMFGQPLAAADPAPAPESPPTPEPSIKTGPEGTVAGETVTAGEPEVSPAPPAEAPKQAEMPALTQQPASEPVDTSQAEPVQAVAPASTPTEPLPNTTPTLNSSIQPLAKEDGYLVTVSQIDADSAIARLGEETQALELDPVSGTWQGTVPYDKKTVDTNGEPLSILLVKDRQVEEVPLAFVAPNAEAKDVYAFNQPDDEVTFFGFLKVGKLGDYARKMYILTIVALGVLLIMNTIIKQEVRRHSVLAHTLFVILLATVLAVA